MILMNTSTPIVAFADHITTVLELTDLRAMSSALFSLGLPVAWLYRSSRALRRPAFV